MKRVLSALLIVATSLTLTACTRWQVSKVLGKPPSQVTQAEIEHMTKALAAVQAHQAAEAQRLGEFLRFARALRDQPFLVCTRQRESRGNYQIVSPGGTWHGAYQFAINTWNNTARHAGWSHLVGVAPEHVHPFWQDMMAWHLYQWQGKSPWNGHC